MKGVTRGRPNTRLVGKASTPNCWIKCGNSSASRMKTRSGALRKLPAPAPPTKATEAAAALAPAATPERRRIASCRTGNCRSHQGQPWRVNMITTCSWPCAMAWTSAEAKFWRQSSVTGLPSVLVGSARRTKLPSLIKTSSPLWGWTVSSRSPSADPPWASLCSAPGALLIALRPERRAAAATRRSRAIPQRALVESLSR
mmetsp:Transcript_90672/g.270611  ORF Transcript_90672/g.270611 Transcript_90672/m.270611 type:complete len:200 (+) Transcript_90672:247-846(+)